jgi:hypothetical protein
MRYSVIWGMEHHAHSRLGCWYPTVPPCLSSMFTLHELCSMYPVVMVIRRPGRAADPLCSF